MVIKTKTLNRKKQTEEILRQVLAFILIDLWLIIPLRYREWVEKKNPPHGRVYPIV